MLCLMARCRRRGEAAVGVVHGYRYPLVNLRSFTSWPIELRGATSRLMLVVSGVNFVCPAFKNETNSASFLVKPGKVVRTLPSPLTTAYRGKATVPNFSCCIC